MTQLSAQPTTLLQRYQRVRGRTEAIVRSFEPEDCVVQTMDDVSPAKWHLAHTTWFFENFILDLGGEAYRVFRPDFGFLFNSYYEAVGPRHARPLRGRLTRPTLDEVFAYRAYVDDAMTELLPGAAEEMMAVVELGINHEEQHQELILTDIKHVLGTQPTEPRLDLNDVPDPSSVSSADSWVRNSGGRREIGHDGKGFAFDNEAPRHEILTQPFEIRTTPITNAEFLRFIEDDGYSDSRWWLSDGWNVRKQELWSAPLYWNQEGGQWTEYTLEGRQPLRSDAPLRHVSFFEADAFARWAGARLPTEQEWEIAYDDSAELRVSSGSVWEWTASPYTAYPGYRAPGGALGEYNGKFMCNQMVLRGGSWATPPGHARGTYRNFFYPQARWQYSGVRLAR